MRHQVARLKPNSIGTVDAGCFVPLWEYCGACARGYGRAD
jgi:hypothetical protein